VDGAPYAQEYGGGQTGQGSSDRHRRRLHDRRTQSMGQSALCAGIRPNFLVGLRGGVRFVHSRSPSGNPVFSQGFISLSNPLPFSFLAAERLKPQSASFALMDYTVPARAYIKKSIHKGRNPLLPNYVGHIARKPVYKADVTLESSDDILIRTERGVREVTIEEWGELKGYPQSWGNTAKDRRRIIQETSQIFWSVLGDAFAPTLLQQENPKLEHNEEYKYTTSVTHTTMGRGFFRLGIRG
jgi:hypothetical protein